MDKKKNNILQESSGERRIGDIHKTSLQGMVIMQEFKIVEVNEDFAKITGFSIDEILSFTPQQTKNLVHPDDQEFVWENYRNRLAGMDIPPHYVFRGVDKNKNILFLDLYVTKIEYGGKPAVQGFLLDITEQVKARESLEQRNKFIETILNNLPIGVVVSELDSGKSTFINEEFEKMLGWPKTEIPGIELLFKKFLSGTDFENHFTDRLRFNLSNKKTDYVFFENLEMKTKTGDNKYLSIKCIPLYDQNLLITTIQDMTERILTENKIQSSLKEKEILLREIHHRVKNNLQTISSLLDLQAESINDPKSLEAFKSSQNRIRSMALIHERLYKSENLSRIKACEYIKNLTEYLESTFIAQSGNIEMTTEVDDIYMSLDIAIPCGLIVNELVSNAMKHAFNGRRNGKVIVNLRSLENKTLKLTVHDNGIGISKNSNSENSSLGLQLVDLLVKQINGKIHINNTEGTKFEITFPLQYL